MLLLSGDDVKKLLEADDAIDAVKRSFQDLTSGNVDAWRTSLDMSTYNGTFLAMSAHVKGMAGIGLKVVTVYKENAEKFGLPNVLATMLLFKPTTGELIAIMDGAYLTAMRTAAGSALASQYLSRRDSRTLGIIGAGTQGRAHLLTIPRVRDIRRVLVHDSNPSRLAKFVKEMSKSNSPEIVEATSPRELVEESDIIVTSTTSSTPVFKGEWLKNGTHINSIMSINPTMRELDDQTMTISRIVVDDRSAAIHEAGDLIQPLEKKLIAEGDIVSLGEIIAGRSTGRTDNDKITVFKSVGVASHDVWVALKVFEKAIVGKTGQSFTM